MKKTTLLAVGFWIVSGALFAQKPETIFNQFENSLKTAAPNSLYNNLKTFYHYGNGSAVNHSSWIESLKTVQSEKDLPTLSKIVKEAVALNASFRLFTTEKLENVPGSNNLKVVHLNVNYNGMTNTSTLKALHKNWQSQGMSQDQIYRHGMMSIICFTMPTLDPTSKVSHEIISPVYDMPITPDNTLKKIHVVLYSADKTNWKIMGIPKKWLPK
ncbi:MAG: hypothetical protein MH137_08240 [Flavobacteriales bacterium]|nr:hypothetical protein [Flavobacteriales bacterium]